MNELRQAVKDAQEAQKNGEKESAVRLAAAVRVYGDPETLRDVVGVPVEASRSALRTADASQVDRAVADLVERAARQPSGRRRARGKAAAETSPVPAGPASPVDDEQPQAGGWPGAVDQTRHEGEQTGPDQ
ncbi:hypothetical protein [Nonomuraea jabiensis]|uniref:hypothetical protein n=1 Tax=Nonomuraea jabiensis TaxID=882448 RepID=UPI003D72BE27